MILSLILSIKHDENQQALLKDPLHVPVGPTNRARSKKIKEALNGLIQDICVDSTTRHSKLGPKEKEGVTKNVFFVMDETSLQDTFAPNHAI